MNKFAKRQAMFDFLKRELEPIGKILKPELKAKWASAHPELHDQFHNLIKSVMDTSAGRFVNTKDYYLSKTASESCSRFKNKINRNRQRAASLEWARSKRLIEHNR